MLTTAMAINSNSFIGIGASNPTHRLTMIAEDQSMLGPHVAYYTSTDTVHPVFQQRNWSHDDIAMTFDAFYDSNTSSWLSSSSNGNFQIYKQGGNLLFLTACNIFPNADIGSTWQPALSINSNSYIGINTSNQTHRLTIAGPSNSTIGPHIAFHTNDDPTYPIFQQYNNRHDLISFNFDSFWNGNSWISSHSNGNFQILKNDGRLAFRAIPYQVEGGVLDGAWLNSLTINSNGYIGIGTSNPEYQLDIQGSVIFRSNAYFLSNLLPLSNMMYDLGASNLRWRDLYLSGESINLQELMLKKDINTGGLYVYSEQYQEPARIWAKEIMIGDPTDLLNSNVFLLSASNNTLKIGNVTSNASTQNFSQFNNLYITPSRIGVGTSNPEKAATFIGDQEINPYISRTIQWTDVSLRIDIDDFKGNRENANITQWGDVSAYGYPRYFSSEGYYDGDFVQCTRDSNCFTLCNALSMNVFINDGLTIFAMVRFNRDIQNNEAIFSFSNNGQYMSLCRHEMTDRLKFVTTEIAGAPLLSPNHTLFQNEWALYTIRYDGVSSKIELFKNINYLSVNLVTTHQPIASATIAGLSDYNFQPMSDMWIGNANIDITHLYLFDRYVGSDELLDLQRTIIYHANASLLIKTKAQPYPPFEFYTDPSGWLFDGKRDGGQVYKKTYNHMLHGNGTYRVWSSSENSMYPVKAAFNVIDAGEWQTDITTYTQTFNAVQPVVFGVEFPLQISVDSYTITGSYANPSTSPSSWILEGSVDQKTWYTLDVQDNEQGWTSGELRGYTVVSVMPVKHIRFKIFKNASSGANAIGMQTFQLYGNEISLQVDGSGLGINTACLKERLTVEGSVSISQCNKIGKHVQSLKPNLLKLPPAAMASNVSTFHDDTYVIRTSSSTANEPGYQAFDASTLSVWSSASNMYNATGGYIGNTTTMVGADSRSGEWIEIQIPKAARLCSYSITPVSIVSAPSTFYVVGSLDGTSWNQVDYQIKTWSAPVSASNFFVSPMSNLMYYNYYRLIANKIGSGGTSLTTASVVNWSLFGEFTLQPKGDTGLNVVHGRSYVSDELMVGSCALYDTFQVIKLDPRDLSINYVNGAIIDSWGSSFGQENQLYRPMFANVGGHHNTSFVRFQQDFMEYGAGNLQLKDGITIVALASFTGASAVQDEPILRFHGASHPVMTFGRYNNSQQISWTIFNSNASGSNTLQSGVGNVFQQNQWNVWAARYTFADNKLELFQNNTLVSSVIGNVTLSDVDYSTCTIASSNTYVDIGGCYMWNVPLSSTDLAQVTDTLMQGYPSAYVQGSMRVSQSLEGGLVVKSASTFTNMVNRYPPTDLTSPMTTIYNQVYGNGTYVVTTSSYHPDYNGYNAFNKNSAHGWYGEGSTFSSVTGLYTGSAVSASTLGEWIQIEMPDDTLALYYTLQPRSTDYGVTSPSTWNLMGSLNGLDWTVLDTKNYSFTSSAEVTFDISSNTQSCRFYRLVITTVSTGQGGTGTVGVRRMFVFAKSRDTMVCQDDKVIVYDKLGIGLSNPAASLHVAGLSVLSGLKIVAGNSSNVVVSGGNGSSMWSSGVNGVYVMSNVGIKTSASATAALNVSGNVGINQSSPTCPLHVSGANAMYTNTGTIVYFDNTNTSNLTATNTTYGANWSIRADQYIGASGFISVSDVRVKHHIHTLAVNIEKFMDLRPVQYQFKDVAKGTHVHYGLIAQEVQTILPNAVYESADYVPDVYKHAMCCNNRVYLNTTLQANEKIRMITKDGLWIHATILNNDGDSFVINNLPALNGEIFVYGRYVTDHLNIDYQHVLSFTMSHVQELYRIIQRQEAAIETLKQQVSVFSKYGEPHFFHVCK
jgi:hypothetical protein